MEKVIKGYSLPKEWIVENKCPIFIETDLNRTYEILQRNNGKFTIINMAPPHEVVNIETFMSVLPNDEVLDLVNNNKSGKMKIFSFNGISKDSLLSIVHDGKKDPLILAGLIKKCYIQLRLDEKIIYSHMFDDFPGEKIPIAELEGRIKINTEDASYILEKESRKKYFIDGDTRKKQIALNSLLNFGTNEDENIAALKYNKVPLITSNEYLYIGKPFVIAGEKSTKYVTKPIISVEVNGTVFKTKPVAENGISYEVGNNIDTVNLAILMQPFLKENSFIK